MDRKKNPRSIYLFSITIIVEDKDYAKFLNLMYRVYSSVETAEYLDQGSLDEKLLQILNLIIKYKGRMFTGRHYNDVTYGMNL